MSTEPTSVNWAEAYAYPDPLPARGWVRGGMICSVDGSAAGPDGLSGSLGTPADKRVFDTLRGLADVVLVGAGTARAEGYLLPEPVAAFTERRLATGQPAAAWLAVVTASGSVSEALLADAARRATDRGQLLVFTTQRGARDGIARVRASFGSAAVQVCGEDTVDIGTAIDHLVARGLRRVVCEGGPSLLADVAAAGRLDELCLTVSPHLVGGDAERILHGEHPLAANPVPLDLVHALDVDGTLLTRWRVRRSHHK